jgi:hypothetical protein
MIKNINFCLLVISYLFAMNAYTKDFKYSETFECSKEIPKDGSKGSDVTMLHYKYWEHYFFSLSNNGDFVVENDSKQYANFTKTKYIQTYFQNGGITSAKFKRENGIDVYELIEENYNETSVNTFMLNKKAMTFTSRIRRNEKNYEPTYGFCYSLITNHKK